MIRFLLVAGAALLVVGCGKRNVATAPPAVVVVTKPQPAAPVRRARRAPAPPAPAVLAPPVLESMRTPEERQSVLAQIGASLERAESNLTMLRGRQLAPEMVRDTARVDSFIRSARTAQKSNDLTTAREYAQRAEILSDDLLKR